jgi:hypothetical protein
MFPGIGEGIGVPFPSAAVLAGAAAFGLVAAAGAAAIGLDDGTDAAGAFRFAGGGAADPPISSTSTSYVFPLTVTLKFFIAIFLLIY